MKFTKKDIHLTIDGLGIVFYSPETNKNIPNGYNFFGEEYSEPEDVVSHIKKGDVVKAYIFLPPKGKDFITD